MQEKHFFSSLSAALWLRFWSGVLYSPTTDAWALLPKFFLANVIYKWDVFGLGLKNCWIWQSKMKKVIKRWIQLQIGLDPKLLLLVCCLVQKWHVVSGTLEMAIVFSEFIWDWMVWSKMGREGKADCKAGLAAEIHIKLRNIRMRNELIRAI